LARHLVPNARPMPMFAPGLFTEVEEITSVVGIPAV